MTSTTNTRSVSSERTSRLPACLYCTPSVQSDVNLDSYWYRSCFVHLLFLVPPDKKDYNFQRQSNTVSLSESPSS